ncbi:hypothetical protein G9A89_002304 [Geosiphon pyriformis]|nr:hypothetical protein G9A89_002304 [Geosiphon pyriformis]
MKDRFFFIGSLVVLNSDIVEAGEISLIYGRPKVKFVGGDKLLPDDKYDDGEPYLRDPDGCMAGDETGDDIGDDSGVEYGD